MQIRNIMNNVLAYLVGSSKNRSKNEIDTKFLVEIIDKSKKRKRVVGLKE